MSKLLDNEKSGRKQASSSSGGNVVLISKTKKAHHNRQQNIEKAQVHVIPLPHKQLQPQIDSKPLELRVLLVENNADERRACRNALQQFGAFSVDLSEVPNGEEGLYLASQETFDCILLDYLLPDMTSMEFLGRLNELLGLLHPPILKLVESSKLELAVEAIKRSSHDYLIKDDDGHYLKLLPTAIQRMLECRRIAHEKHQIETMYRTLVEHIPAITYVASMRNGNHLLYVSPQIEQLGYRSDYWLSRPELRFQCIYEDDRYEVEQAFAHSRDSGELFRCEYRMRSNSGKLHWFLDEARVIKDQNGQVMFFQGVMLDITDKKFMESELQSHRHFLEQRVHACTEQLEKRIAILESCNRELCNQLEKEHMTNNELRKVKSKQEAMLRAIGDGGALLNALIS